MSNPSESDRRSIRRTLAALPLLALVACSGEMPMDAEGMDAAEPAAQQVGLRLVDLSQLTAAELAEGALAEDKEPGLDEALIAKAAGEFWRPKINGYPINFDGSSKRQFCASKGYGSVLYSEDEYISQTTIAAQWSSNQWLFVVGWPPFQGDRFITQSLRCRP